MSNEAYRVARMFMERAKACNYKGKKRDDAALDYFCGASTAYDHSSGAYAALCGAILLISTRGYNEVCRLAEKERLSCDADYEGE